MSADKVAGMVLGCVAAIANLPNAKQLDRKAVENTLAALTALDIPEDAIAGAKAVVDDIFRAIKDVP